MKMEIDRYNFAKLVTACECYYRLDEIVSDLSDGAGLSGEKSWAYFMCGRCD